MKSKTNLTVKFILDEKEKKLMREANNMIIDMKSVLYKNRIENKAKKLDKVIPLIGDIIDGKEIGDQNESREVWIVGYRNDRFCENIISLYFTHQKAKAAFDEWVKDREDEENFECDNNIASWNESNGSFVQVMLWCQEVE